MAKALEAEGYRVITEHDGGRALALFEEEPPDMALLDLFLPGCDGFSLLEAVRSMQSPAQSTAVVLLSGCAATPDYRKRAKQLDALALLTKPVPLERLTRVVGGHLSVEKGPARADGNDETSLQGGELAGELERFSFPALLHHLHGSRASGVVHLESGRKRKWVQLREGYPVGVRSNLLSETLGSVLEREGRISTEALEASRERMSEGQMQGEMLVAMELLTEDELAEALREQAEAKLYEIFEWVRGRFRFEFGAQLHRATGLVRCSPANLILQGMRTRTPLERIDGWLRAQQHLHLVHTEEPFYRFQEVDLASHHRELIEGLGSGKPLAPVLDGPEELRRTVFGLIRAGLLELHAEGVRRPAPSAPAVDAPDAAEAASARIEGERAALSALVERYSQQSPEEILEVSEDPEESELKAAYERLAARTHPDRVAGSGTAVRTLAAEAFAHVERAYEALLDPNRREEIELERQRRQRAERDKVEGRRAHDAERHYAEGQDALSRRAYPDALRCFGKSLELFPQEGEYHSYYGWALHLCHPDDAAMAEEGLEHCKRGMKLAGDRETAYLLAGRLCKATGRADAAERMFARAAQIRPDCIEALRELRLINMRRDKEKGLIQRLLRR